MLISATRSGETRVVSGGSREAPGRGETHAGPEVSRSGAGEVVGADPAAPAPKGVVRSTGCSAPVGVVPADDGFGWPAVGPLAADDALLPPSKCAPRGPRGPWRL